MNLYELSGNEQHPIYARVQTSNQGRVYSFLSSMIQAAIDSHKPWLSESLIKAVNFHAIVGLHDEAGQYRSHDVWRGGDNHIYPAPYRVRPLMEDLVNTVNRNWASDNLVKLSASVLWHINLIHPFVNGNGRTARAISYFVLCVKAGALLRGQSIVPEILRTTRYAEYIQALKVADTGDLSQLEALIIQSLREQLQ
jgi:Fic family protein